MRIGIVHQQALAARTLERGVLLSPAHRVVWTANTGADAVECCVRDTPDVLLLDVMTDGDGADVTRRIMAAAPCAILLIATNLRAQTARAYDAMGCGALDAVDMPSLDPANAAGSVAPLLMKIATISRLIGAAEPVPLFSAERRGRPAACRQLVAIGASAGGPAALAEVLRGLPADFPAAIVIVQHVDQQFATGMADWLRQHSALPVAVAAEGDQPTGGRVLIAGTNEHLVLSAPDRLGYVAEPLACAYRPSIDVFFDSAAHLWKGDLFGVLLTGMGRDGAVGLKGLRDGGHYTIAQDEATSAVYGMPKAAASLNAAVDVLPVDRIASRLRALVAPLARTAS